MATAAKRQLAIPAALSRELDQLARREGKKSTAYYGDEVIRTVTLSQARQGQIESALKTCNRFRSRDFRAKTYQDVAEEWVKRDDKETVMKWASQLPLKIEKAYALVGIARGVRHETEK